LPCKKIVNQLVLAGIFVFGSVCPAEQHGFMDTDSLGFDANSILSKTGAERQAAIEKLAAENHLNLIRLAIYNSRQNHKDYVGTFYKQERVRGKLLPRQTIEFKFRKEPFSVFMDVVQGAGPADKILFVEGENRDRMVVHPTNPLVRWMKSVDRDPLDKEVFKTNLKPITKFGFANTLEIMSATYEKAQREGILNVKYTGPCEVNGMKGVGVEVEFSEDKKQPDHKTEIVIDFEHLVPIFVESKSLDGKLLYHYSYEDLKFNVGLEDKDFTPAKVGL